MCMDRQLENKRALVTGGSQSIRAITGSVGKLLV